LVVNAAVVMPNLQDRQREGALLRPGRSSEFAGAGKPCLEFALRGGFAGILGLLRLEARGLSPFQMKCSKGLSAFIGR